MFYILLKNEIIDENQYNEYIQKFNEKSAIFAQIGKTIKNRKILSFNQINEFKKDVEENKKEIKNDKNETDIKEEEKVKKAKLNIKNDKNINGKNNNNIAIKENNLNEKKKIIISLKIKI